MFFLLTQNLKKKNYRNFAFKCHREGNDIYSVNSISFHSVYGTFATAGSDGTFHYWDKDSKQRLKQFPKVNQSISAATFNVEGNFYAYASSYDWGKVNSKKKKKRTFFFQAKK